MDTLNDTNSGASKSALDRFKEYVKGHVLLILIGVVVLSSGTAVYFYGQYAELMRDPNKLAQDEITKLVAQISKIMIFSYHNELFPEINPSIFTFIYPESPLIGFIVIFLDI